MSFIIYGVEVMTLTLAAFITVAVMSGSVELRAFVKKYDKRSN